VDLKAVIDTRRREEPDLVLLITVFVLAGIGLAMSYSASAPYAQKTFGDSFYFLKRQFVWCMGGFAALLFFQRVDYRVYVRYTKVMLIAALVILAAVLVPGVAKSVKGSARWISLGFIHIQPSEMAKIVVVIYLAKVFSTEDDGIANHVIQLLVPIDLLFVAVAILFVSGFPFIYIGMLSALSVPMFYLLIYQVAYRRDRLLAFFDPWRDRYGIGYHIIQSFIAFRKGGLLGAGLGYGTQKIKHLPEPHTDFIFAVIAEETGLLGTLFIVFLFSLFMWRGMQIAMGAPDEFGRLLAIGLTLMIVVQAFINIGVVSGSLPTTGIPLPFISYGGSSLFSNMMAAGVLLNISRYRETVSEDVKLAEGVWK
jgi:cell division protein FtsW